jgi:hypothetical protein
MLNVTVSARTENISNTEILETNPVQNNAKTTSPRMTEKEALVTPLQNLSTLDKEDKTNHIAYLPTEIKWKIFQHIVDKKKSSADNIKHLLSFATSSKKNANEVGEFLKHDDEGRVLGKELKEKKWNATVKKLLENASILKNHWILGGDQFLNRLDKKIDKKNETAAGFFPKEYLGMEIRFGLMQKYSQFASVLTKEISPGVAIKFNSEGIGRERVLAEVFPALLDAHPDCPLIVNLSGNKLTEEDLNPLIAFMAENHAIYQLDLSNNNLCTGAAPSEGIKNLFGVLGPVTHLYLNNTGLNDRTALTIQDHIKSNSCLQHLDLQQNQLSKNGAIAIVDAVYSVNSPGDTKYIADIVIHKSLRAVRLLNNLFEFDNALVNKLLLAKGIGSSRNSFFDVSYFFFQNRANTVVEIDFSQNPDYDYFHIEEIQATFNSRAEQEKL